VRSVAADEEGSADLPLAAGGVPDGGGDDVAGVGVGEADQLHAGLDRTAELCDPLPQECLGPLLRQMQQEPVHRPAVRHVDADEVPAAGVDTDAAHPVADVEEPVGDPHHVQGLERPGHDADRPAQVGPARVLVDDPRVHATGQQLGGQGEPGGAGAHDEHVAIGVVDGADRQAHPPGDLAVGEPAGHELRHLHLAAGQSEARSRPPGLLGLGRQRHRQRVVERQVAALGTQGI
jgi:hypothetical protein